MTAGGVVLCGGRSSRMGRPKAWLPFGGEVLLQRVVRVVGEAVAPVVVVAAPGQDVPSLPPEVEIVRDDVGRPRAVCRGWLRGWRRSPGGSMRCSCRRATRRSCGRRSCGGCWRCSATTRPPCRPSAACLHPARRRLPRERSSRSPPPPRPPTSSAPPPLFESIPTRLIEALDLADIDPALDALRNLNTPEDYTAAVRELAFP